MDHDEQEMADVMVVLADDPGLKMDQAIALLQDIGLMVSKSDDENGVVEGTCAVSKLKAIKSLAFVKYVRDVFDYTNDLTPQDEDEGVDDAGR